MEKFIGLDLGSTYTKLVEIEGEEIVRKEVTRTAKNRELIPDINRNLCTTGYFRKQVKSEFTITEITAAMVGARHYFPECEVVVDIGGQDIKVVDLRDNRFYINDKCSAGTGAFFEFILAYLGLDFEMLENLDDGKILYLNNTCTVFALSEILSHLANGARPADVVAGLNHAFAKKVVEIVPPAAKVVLIGGVAKNRGFVKAFREAVSSEVLVPPEPQIVNALGAARYALERRK
ncbi:MAG: acyl-CoA dehydratase activase [Thermoplasmata archaeon]|nr:acyl-CoA dehydratase activase [Thermoplasmata archaeon]